ncbi:MAG: hypothetical protein GX047_09820 [Firmicutes bacterium]|nr:hypothetical protein [Bacillota bacterium]
MKTAVRGILLGLIAAVIIAVANQATLAFGVRPLVIDIDCRPGDTRDFEIILNPGNTEETVQLSLYQPVQMLSGNLAYQEPVPETFPAVDWVRLDSQEVKVYPGEDTYVRGTVRVPFDAGGSHTVVLMAEPKVETDQPGITLIVRYAIRLNIRVDRPGLRTVAELKEFDLVPGPEGEPVITARVANPSAWDYLVSGEVTIRDSGRRLVERIQLNSEAGARANLTETRIYPGSEVEYTGVVTRRLNPGDYTLRLFLRYGEHGQIIKTKDITVAEGQFSFPSAEEIGAFTVEPDVISMEIRAGQQRSQVLQLTSEIMEPAVILVGGRDVEAEYTYSPLGWLELRGPGEINLPGRGKGRIVLTVAVPKDADDASYNGYILLGAFDPESGELLSEREIPISILVGTDHLYAVEIKSLEAEKVEEGHMLYLDIANTGNVDLIPRADLLITTEAGEFVERAVLTLGEGTEKVMPLQRQQLEGLAQGLEPGSYEVTVTISDGTRELLTTDMILDIPD